VEDVDAATCESETFDVVAIEITATEPSEQVGNNDDYWFVDDVDADSAVHVDNVSGDDESREGAQSAVPVLEHDAID
jgi:hypothetical protein